MDHQLSASVPVRASERTTKGVPPERWGFSPVASSSAVPKMTGVTAKSTSSKGSGQMKKELEVKRDDEIIKLKSDYAEMQKQSNLLNVAYRRATRNLEELRQKEGGDNAEVIKKAEAERERIRDDVDIIDAELQAFEVTYKDKLQAIRNKCDLELEKLSSDDESGSLSIEDENEVQKMERITKWSGQGTSSQPYVDGVDEDLLSIHQSEQEMFEDARSSAGNQNAVPREPHPPQFQLNIPKPQQPAWQPATYTYIHRQQMPPPEDGYYSPPPVHQQQRPPAEMYHSPPPERKLQQRQREQQAPAPSAQGGDVVSQLVSALGQAFGSQNNDVVIKNAIDKNLPKFDGNPADWQNFRSEYVRTTRKYKFEATENLTRLRTSLTGDALAAVKHLLANSMNMEKIWENLEKRFGRPEFVLDYLVERAKATKSPDPGKPESVIEFGTAIDALVTNICSYNQYDYMCNRQLVNEFVAKLPGTMRTQWHEWLLDDHKRKPDLNYFSQWLSRKVDAAIMAVKPKLPSDSKDEEKKRGRSRAPGAVNAASGENEGKGKAKCPACKMNNHVLAKCWKFQRMPMQERWNLVKETKACICCLNQGHRSKECPDAARCPKDGCSFWHNIMLHSDKKKTDVDSGKQDGVSTPATTAADGKADGSVNAAIIEGVDGPLQIVPVKLKKRNQPGFVSTYALLDGGATRSLILKSLSTELGLDGELQDYSYCGINGQKVMVKNAKKVNCEAAGNFAGSRYHGVVNCVTVDNIQIKPYTFNMKEAKKTWPHLRKIGGADLDKVVPQLIIGNNNPELLLPNRVVRGSKGDPVGLRTALGWTVSGNFDVEPGHGSISTTMCGEEATDDYLHDLIKSWFTTESFGVKVLKSKGSNLEDKRAWNILEETTKKVDGRWETGLLWREDNVTFPESEKDAFLRLGYTEKKMVNPVFKQKYLDKFAEYLEKGYMKKLTPAEAALRPPNTKYLPHFGQINPNKPDKFRFILDAKAKANGVSLNDKLLTGPDLIRPLASLFMNFRVHSIALTGDIADMFHRVHIRENDKCSQRLLWRDGDSSKPVDHYQMEVMIFGATSSPASAIYVKNRNADYYKDKYPLTAQIIKTDFYVDDALTGGNSVEEVIELQRQISEINDAGGFKVCKYMSNSQEVLAAIPEDLKAQGVKDLQEKEEIPCERVLGLWWDPNEDVFTFKLSLHKVKQRVLDGEIPTKREMCSLVMSLYDPLGYIAQYRVKGLMILQDTWRCGTGWDDEIPHEINYRWQQWLQMLKDITAVKIPRCYSRNLNSAEDIQLHTFVDASEQGFSSICYLRIQSGNHVDVALVLAKGKVAPLKKLTIPKLELQAAVMGTRMATTIRLELRVRVSSRWFWSDSKTVLSQIRSTGARYKEFVANRIGEIQEDSNAAEWHWVPTKLNVADMATRFESKISFHPDNEWYKGPEFLWMDPSGFPREDREDGMIAVMAANNEENPEASKEKLLSFVPDPTRFSSYLRLLRATAVVVRFAHRILETYGGMKKVSQPDELLTAEKMLIRVAQEDAYSAEIKSLKSGLMVPKKSPILRLDPILDSDGIVRLDGRIAAALVPEEVKFPIILPPKHYITDLIIDFEHKTCAHQGVETVLSNLRQKYWIPEGRKAVQRSWTRCQVCRLQRAKPISPRMGNLPVSRLASNQPAFTFTGLDFFGPMTVTVGRRHEKRWGALFCCQVTRAVHLEVCYGLSTDEVMLALSRFVDTRGRPTLITSDNGTNFVGAAKELKDNFALLDFDRINGSGKFHEIKWIFNPPAAPHMGGSWERLVQIVKKCLASILHEKYPKDTTLLTMLKSVENIVNSRPLTHVSCDPADPEPITPNHFLRGGADAGPGIPAEMHPNDDFLCAQWRRAQLMADQFWRRWTREFLPKLLRRDKWHDPVDPMQVGDLVYLVDENQPRNLWLRGYVSSVFPGDHGQVRIVEVTTRDPNTKKTTVYKRPVTKLCPLGLRMEIQDPKGP